MLQLALACLVIALIAGILGFGGIAGSFVGVAKILFVVFLILAVLSFVGNAMRRRSQGSVHAGWRDHVHCRPTPWRGVRHHDRQRRIGLQFPEARWFTSLFVLRCSVGFFQSPQQES